MPSINLGQVAGIHIGNTAPTNTILIWYDNTPGVNIHKVYDPSSSQWVVLDKNAVISITYANLVLLSQNQLTIGQWFKITDIGNLMAIALTSTIVQYTDINGNIVLDDLGNSKQYIVTNNNLTIDNINGVFNGGKLDFNFALTTPNAGQTWIFGENEVGGVFQLIKMKLSSLISSMPNNNLSFGTDGGIYFNLTNSITSLYDVVNGVVSYSNYLNDINAINSQINAISIAISNITSTFTNYVLTQLSDQNIYSKRVPLIDTSIAPSDAISGDTLQTIVNKFQRYINKYKTAVGIDISPNFTDNANNGWVNNNDTVESAIQKIQYVLKHISTIGVLPSNWVAENYVNNILPLAPGDSFDVSFAKLQGKLNQIGDISNGLIVSKSGVTRINLKEGSVVIDSPSGPIKGFIVVGVNGSANINDDCSEFYYQKTVSNNSIDKVNSSVTIRSKEPYYDNGNKICTSLYAKCEPPINWYQFFTDGVDVVDAFFNSLKVNGISLSDVEVLNNNSFYSISDETSVTLTGNCQGITVLLPSVFSVNVGRFIILRVFASGSSMHLDGNGADIALYNSPSAPVININNAIYILHCCRNNNLKVWYGLKLI